MRCAAWAARVAYAGLRRRGAAGEQPLFEYTWNHTTLHALKHDRTITYLQTPVPPPGPFRKDGPMATEFGDEMPMHLEFCRFNGAVARFGLQLVRYRCEERSRDHRPSRAHDSPVPTRTSTARKRRDEEVDQAQLAFKRGPTRWGCSILAR